MCAGEILGLVGASGSGKSTFAYAALRLLEHTGAIVSGRAYLLDTDLLRCGAGEIREARGRLAGLVPQSPSAALNPALRLETQLREAWRAHSRLPWSDQKPRVLQQLQAAGLPPEESFLRRYPREISVGQAQRVLIVMAILHSPPLLIADEPTSALDVITQRDVLDLLAAVCRQRAMSVLFISHDLATVAALCNRIAILHDGEIVESGATRDVIAAPAHHYTRRLISAVPEWISRASGASGEASDSPARSGGSSGTRPRQDSGSPDTA